MALVFQLICLIDSYGKNVWRSKLCKFIIKVIRIPETSDETYEKITAWGKALGKTTITCKDTPGFVVNRLLVPLMAEAVRMLERGKLCDAT
jgi:3-hydroxyacyl-CoA dehydrogenase